MRKLLLITATTSAVVAGMLVPQAGAAGPSILTKITPAAGWETPLFAANFSAVGEKFSGAAVGDIDGNGVLDVVAGFPDGKIYAWRTDNGARWFEHYTGPGAVQASPGLVDFDGDGRLDVVFANTRGDLGVVRFDGRRVFSAKIGSNDPWGGAFATPAVTDLDRNGSLDVIVSGFDQYLHAFNPAGRELAGFPVHLQDTSWSSPAVGDLDGDGYQEIVVGYDCDGAPGQRCAPNYGGYVGAFRYNGQQLPGWPRFIPKQVVWSSPALADIDLDGRFDVVVGTGNMPATMWDGGRQKMAGTQVFAFRADGSNVPGWPVTVGRNVTSSPAVGDVDGDGRPDVAFVAEDGMLYVYSGTGARLWSRCAGNDPSWVPNDGTVTYGVECPGLHASPSIADVDNDGRQNVVIGGEQWLRVYDGAGGLVSSGETFANTDPMTAAPTIVSVGGKTWIIEVSSTATGGQHGRVFVWTNGLPLGRADWPTFKQSMVRSGAQAGFVPRPLVSWLKNAYSPVIYTLSAGTHAPATYAQWSGAGFPAPRPTPTEYVKYPWAPTVYAVTFWPDAWQWDRMTYEMWRATGFAGVRTAGWIEGSTVYKTASDPTIFVRDPEGLVHALTYAEWAAMGFRTPTLV